MIRSIQDSLPRTRVLPLIAYYDNFSAFLFSVIYFKITVVFGCGLSASTGNLLKVFSLYWKIDLCG